jgi:hypothetical protein
VVVSRRAALALFIIAVSFSFAYPSGNLTITPFEYRDFGNASLPEFDGMAITIDCNSAVLGAHVASSGAPVAGAMTYLEYVDYSTPLLSSRQTDGSGNALHRVPSGNISHMSGLFVLAVEKAGYRRREAHFDIGACFYVPPPTGPGPSAANPVQPVPMPPEQNSTPPASPPANGPQSNAIGNNGSGNQAGTIAANASGNGTANQTGKPAASQGANNGPAACPLPLALFAALGVAFGYILVQKQ